MPSANDKKPDWFDKLPKKTRIVLLMLFTGAASLGFFLDGLHLFRTGQYSSYAEHESSWWGSFFWCAFWFVITGLLFAAYAGWFKDSSDAPTK